VPGVSNTQVVIASCPHWVQHTNDSVANQFHAEEELSVPSVVAYDSEVEGLSRVLVRLFQELSNGTKDEVNWIWLDMEYES
jgi:hypothetical protein